MWGFAGVLLALLSAAPVVARAEGGAVYNLGDKAPVPGNKTWRDLLGQLFTDLRQQPMKDGGRMADFIHGKVDIRPIDKDSFEDCSGTTRCASNTSIMSKRRSTGRCG